VAGASWPSRALGYAVTCQPLHTATVHQLPQSVSRPMPAELDKSVAVLPFVDMSESKDQEYFSDGLSEELINHLSHSAGLKVIARTSSFQFKGRETRTRAPSRAKLGVAHLLEGSVRKGRPGDSRHHAIDPGVRRRAQLWSQTYDRDLTDIFTVQDEIAESVAKALNATLAIVDHTGSAKRRMSRPTTSYWKGTTTKRAEPDPRCGEGGPTLQEGDRYPTPLSHWRGHGSRAPTSTWRTSRERRLPKTTRRSVDGSGPGHPPWTRNWSGPT
jgi:TolB-like protein